MDHNIVRFQIEMCDGALPNGSPEVSKPFEKEEVSIGVAGRKNSLHCERHEIITGISLFCEFIWLGKSILGRIVGGRVEIRGGRRFERVEWPFDVSLLGSFVFSLYGRGMARAYATVTWNDCRSDGEEKKNRIINTYCSYIPTPTVRIAF